MKWAVTAMQQAAEQHQQTVTQLKWAMDGFSVGMLLAWFAGLLGPTATLLTIIWLGMQIVMNWDKCKQVILGRWRSRQSPPDQE